MSIRYHTKLLLLSGFVIILLSLLNNKGSLLKNSLRWLCFFRARERIRRTLVISTIDMRCSLALNILSKMSTAFLRRISFRLNLRSISSNLVLIFLKTCKSLKKAGLKLILFSLNFFFFLKEIFLLFAY